MIETLTPLGVGSEYSCRRSGWLAGHLREIGKSLSVIVIGNGPSACQRAADSGDAQSAACPVTDRPAVDCGLAARRVQSGRIGDRVSPRPALSGGAPRNR